MSGAANFGNRIPVEAGPVAYPQNSPTQALFVGVNAGASFPITTPDNYGTIGFGAGALQSYRTLGGEAVAAGTWAGQYIATGTLFTLLGMHTWGAATTLTGDTACGNDVGRDAFSDGYTVGAGQAALAHGHLGVGTIGIGSQAGRGNSSAVIISGSATAGDTVTIDIVASSNTPATVTGLPVSKTYTVQSGDTLGAIAANLATLLNGTVSSPSYALGAYGRTYPDGTGAVRLAFPGNASLGWAVTVTASASVGATETVSVVTGTNLQQTVVLGGNALQGDALGGFPYGVVVGYTALQNMRGGSSGYCVVVGSGSGQSYTTQIGFTLLGARVGNNAAHSDVVVIGSGSVDVDPIADNSINIRNILLSTGTNVPGTSKSYVAGAFGVGGSSGPTWSSGTGAPSGTKPAGSLYSRTDGTAGSRLYVSDGAGAWNAVAGV